MSLEYAYSRDLKLEINSAQADIAFEEGKITSQKNFLCPECGIAVTCANLEKPKKDRKRDPYFKSVEDHKLDCEKGNNEKTRKSQNKTEEDFYRGIEVQPNKVRINLAPPTAKEQGNPNNNENHTSRRKNEKTSNINGNSKVPQINSRKISSLVTAFLKDEKFEVSLPNPYPEDISLQDLFIEIKGQNINALEQDCWRVYWGKAWINKYDEFYQIKFDSFLCDDDLKPNGQGDRQVQPTFFISNNLVENYPYKKFNEKSMSEMASTKEIKRPPKMVFILADTPALNAKAEHINFVLEGLAYLEIIDWID